MSSQSMAQRVVSFCDVTEDRHVITVTVGPSLEPIILSLRQSPDYRREAGWASFPKQTANHLNEFRIHYSVGDDWFFIDLAPTNENYHSVQPLGTDEWLLVRGRSQSEQDRNAHVYGFDGNVRRSFPAGDGIQDVQVTRDSQIWISFFDEGVFSDVKIGQSGLICLDEHGRKLRDFEMIAGTTGSIADCYALNVCSNQDTWLYYYTDFPLVKLTGGRLAEFWRDIPVSGSSAFAVGRKNNVLFAGGYHEREALIEVHLPTMKKRRLEPVDEEGTRIKQFSAFGRSNYLYLVTEESLFRLDASCS